MYDKILVPLGPELTSNTAALDEAADFAQQSGSSLHLLYVWLNDEERDDHIENDEQKHPEPIQHALGYLDESFDIECYTESGATSDTIVEHAYDIDVDAIVMGTNAATGVKRMVLGSITEEVIRKSSLPVVAVNYHGD